MRTKEQIQSSPVNPGEGFNVAVICGSGVAGESLHRDLTRSAEMALGADSATGGSGGHVVELNVDFVNEVSAGVQLVRAARRSRRFYAVVFIVAGKSDDRQAIKAIEQLRRADPDMQIVLCAPSIGQATAAVEDRLGNMDRVVVQPHPLPGNAARQLASHLCAKWQLDRTRVDSTSHDQTTDDVESWPTEGQLQAIVDATADAIVMTDEKGTIQTFNRAAMAIFGYKEREILGANVSKLMPPPYRREHGSYMRRYQETGKAYLLGIEREFEACRKDGTRFPIALRISEVTDAESRQFVGIVKDLSQQRKAESDLQRFREALDCSADAVLLVDRKSMRFIDMNATACRNLDFTREELLARGPQDVDVHFSREELECQFDEVIASGDGVAQFESVVRRKDGTTFPIEIVLKSLRVDNDDVLVASARDLTQRHRLAAAERRVTYDDLTNVLNRRHFFEVSKHTWRQSERYEHPLSCVLIDLDYFKRVNDTHGHATGDAVLVAVGGILSSHCRDSDLVCRYGGEEFCVLLPETSEEGAAVWAERVRSAIALHVIQTGGDPVQVTSSFGVAERTNITESVEQLIDLADQAVLVAKRSGRNRVVRCSAVCDNSCDLGGAGVKKHPFDSLAARDVMTPLVSCLNERCTVGHAAEFFLQLRLGSAPVVNEAGHLVGIVSEKDLIELDLSAEMWSKTLSEVMTTNVISYEGDTSARDVLDFLNRVFLRCVVVVEDQRPVGIISRASLLRWFSNWVSASYTGELASDTSTLGQRRTSVINTASELARRFHALPSIVSANEDQLIPCVVGETTQMQELINDLLGHCSPRA